MKKWAKWREQLRVAHLWGSNTEHVWNLMELCGACFEEMGISHFPLSHTHTAQKPKRWTRTFQNGLCFVVAWSGNYLLSSLMPVVYFICCAGAGWCLPGARIRTHPARKASSTLPVQGRTICIKRDKNNGGGDWFHHPTEGEEPTAQIKPHMWWCDDRTWWYERREEFSWCHTHKAWSLCVKLWTLDRIWTG